MIQKLRIRFITASMLALTLVLLVILGGTNLMSYRKILQEADAILEVLSEGGGRFPQPMEPERGRPRNTPFQKHQLSPETPYESRFYSVTLDSTGAVTSVDTLMTVSVDRETAVQTAYAVHASGRETGFWGSFRYRTLSGTEGSRIIFLDCSRSLSHFRTTLLASIGVSAAGLLAVLALLILFSGRIIRPVAESYEKQKRFITDAGHELKTPLTVIGADLDLAELECGENEWLQDIRLQTQRLADLTRDLITLSRMDEGQQTAPNEEFLLTDAVEEAAQSFQALPAQREQTFSVSLQPMLSMTGNRQDIRKLVTILLDNAVKYTPNGGSIRLTLTAKGKTNQLTVTNTVPDTVTAQQVSRFFDRFYRGDAARSTTGGYGLGLSIAQSIVHTHRGTLQAALSSPTLTLTATFPAK